MVETGHDRLEAFEPRHASDRRVELRKEFGDVRLARALARDLDRHDLRASCHIARNIRVSLWQQGLFVHQDDPVAGARRSAVGAALPITSSPWSLSHPTYAEAPSGV